MLATLLCAASCNDAPAQAAGNDDGPLTRQRPEYSPRGFALGGLRAYPSLAQQIIFDDNVFSTQDGSETGFVFDTSPAISLQSDWNRHRLALDARSTVGRNPSFPSENYVDWEFGGNGQLEFSQRIGVAAGVSFSHDHVNRSAPNEERGIEPTEFTEVDAFVRYQQNLGQFDVALNARTRMRDFDDVLALRNDNLFVLNQDDRDRTQFTLGLRTSYRLSGMLTAFLDPKAQIRDYDQLQDGILADRSSEGYELSGGVEFELMGYGAGEVSLGYRLQDYDTPYPDISTPLFAVSGQLNLTPLTSLILSSERRIAETQGSSFSGYVSTRVLVRVDHELLRNLMVNSEFSWRGDTYEGVDSAERDDTTYNVRLGANYLLNRHINILLDFYYLKRDSVANVTDDTVSNSVQKKLVILGLSLRL